jgi:predicted transcriptional regulator
MENYIVDRSLPFMPLQKKYRLCGFPLGKKYRSHFEIIALIVEAAKDGCQGKFSVMKHASINCGQANKFLNSLVEMGFIDERLLEGKPFYRTSERGLAFLRQYYVLLSMLLAVENGKKQPAFVYEPILRHE